MISALSVRLVDERSDPQSQIRNLFRISSERSLNLQPRWGIDATVLAPRTSPTRNSNKPKLNKVLGRQLTLVWYITLALCSLGLSRPSHPKSLQLREVVYDVSWRYQSSPAFASAIEGPFDWPADRGFKKGLFCWHSFQGQRWPLRATPR